MAIVVLGALKPKRSSCRAGFSALQLQRQLGIGRYETAWTMLQKLRRAMRRPQREALLDKVEVDETFIGNQEGLRGGREIGDRALTGFVTA